LIEGNEGKIDEEESAILKSMSEALRVAGENIHLTKTRIGAEAEYIKSQDNKTSSRYTEAVRNEYAIEEKLLKIINPADIETGTAFSNKKVNTKTAIAAGAVSMVTGGPVIIAIAAMMIQYKLETEKIMKQQRDALLKFDHRDHR